MSVPDDTRDIAIRTETKVEALTETVDKIEKKVNDLCNLAEQGKGIAGALRMVGYSSTGGAIAMLYEHGTAIMRNLGIK